MNLLLCWDSTRACLFYDRGNAFQSRHSSTSWPLNSIRRCWHYRLRCQYFLHSKHCSPCDFCSTSNGKDSFSWSEQLLLHHHRRRRRIIHLHLLLCLSSFCLLRLYIIYLEISRIIQVIAERHTTTINNYIAISKIWDKENVAKKRTKKVIGDLS